MDIKIRSELLRDYDEIDLVIFSAFKQYNEVKLVHELRKTKQYNTDLSLVATSNGQIIGHILFYPVKMSDYETLILAPLAVKPKYQRKGIGGKLIEEGLKQSREQGYGSVLVLGHPDYYPRFGFEKASKWGIRLSTNVPDVAFMAIQLRENSLLGKKGVVQLPHPYLEC